MADTIIHMTAERLAHEQLPIAGERRVEVRIIDATAEEERALLIRALEEAAADPVRLSEEDVFGGLYAMLEAKYGVRNG
ncbi:hypothetical protein [Niveispirillum sp. KHB5.9]|uniref:hypothetical protein n=1 Tax=Niveispirillum sp. KHB5.9 TaxID=3400269 RepID=UPI003A841666